MDISGCVPLKVTTDVETTCLPVDTVVNKASPPNQNRLISNKLVNVLMEHEG